jgi:hypothetical protein
VTTTHITLTRRVGGGTAPIRVDADQVIAVFKRPYTNPNKAGDILTETLAIRDPQAPGNGWQVEGDQVAAVVAAAGGLFAGDEGADASNTWVEYRLAGPLGGIVPQDAPSVYVRPGFALGETFADGSRTLVSGITVRAAE